MGEQMNKFAEKKRAVVPPLHGRIDRSFKIFLKNKQTFL